MVLLVRPGQLGAGQGCLSHLQLACRGSRPISDDLAGVAFKCVFHDARGVMLTLWQQLTSHATAAFCGDTTHNEASLFDPFPRKD